MGKIRRTAKEVKVNERIRVPQIRLVDETGKMLGVLNTREALDMARGKGYDLVMVSPGATPPVCRIMDYGKYKYEQSKKARRARKKQHTVHVKEVKMRPGIEEHDYGFKMNHARRFLEHHDKVKFSLIFRGREVTHPDIGRRLLERVASDLSEIATIEVGPKMEGHSMILIVCPKPGLKKVEAETVDSKGDEDAED